MLISFFCGRPRFRVSGGKSDRFDAFVLCELARTDSDRFRVLEPDSDRTKALRALSRAREDLVQTRTALANQLRAELERFWPGRSACSATGQRHLAGVPGALPSAVDAHGLGERRLQAFWPASATAAGRSRLGCWPSSRPRHRGAPASSRCRSAGSSCSGMWPRSNRSLRRSRRSSGRSLTPSSSIPTGRSSARCSAIQLRRDRRHDAHRDRRLRAATLPRRARRRRRPGTVAVEYGKRKVACFRWACNKRLRSAFCTLADATRHWHPWAADHYARQIAAGHDHQRAIAPSAAPGAASSGAAGKTVPPTTQPATARSKRTARSRSPPPRAPGPTQPPQPYVPEVACAGDGFGP